MTRNIETDESDRCANDSSFGLIPLTHIRLRQMAKNRLKKETVDCSLQADELVSETCLRLIRKPDKIWPSQRYFLGAASRGMRQVLIDNARKRNAKKRPQYRLKAEVDFADLYTREEPVDILALRESLRRLRTIDRTKSTILDLLFFEGFTIKETATFLRRSCGVIRRELRVALAKLKRELGAITNSHETPTRTGIRS